MTRLRIELVSEHASPLATVGEPDAGGQNVHVAALATQLAALGCQVTVATRADAPDLAERVVMAPGVEVRHVRAGPPRPLAKDKLWAHMPAFARELRRRWLRRPPDVVHAHFWMSGWAARQAAGGLPAPPPVAQTFHALGVVKRRHQGAADTSPPDRCAVEAELVRTVDHVIATCSDEVVELVALGGRREHITVVPCGVDTSAFRPGGPAAPARQGGHRVVVVSRLVPRKGIDDVVASLPHLPGTQRGGGGRASRRRAGRRPGGPAAPRRGPRAGRGPPRAAARRRGARGRAAAAALGRRRGLRAVVRALRHRPGRGHGLRRAGGRQLGGLLDTIDDRRTGLLVPPRDPVAVAAAAARLLDNPSLRTHMGAEAAARVRQAYTWPQVARSTLEVYRGLLVGRSTPAPAAGRDWAVPA